MAKIKEDYSEKGLQTEHLPNDRSIWALPEGRAVWTRGRPLEFIYFLFRGQVRIVVADERGRETVIRIVQIGEPFGLTSLSARRRLLVPTTAVASVRSELIEIPSDELTPSCIGMTRLYSPVDHPGERLAFADERLRIFANHGAEDRLCALLEQLSSRWGDCERRGLVQYRRSSPLLVDTVALARRRECGRLAIFDTSDQNGNADKEANKHC